MAVEVSCVEIDWRGHLFRKPTMARVATKGCTMHELRRSLPRQFADWRGRYILDSDPHWRDCRVIDISAAGAGLELLGAPRQIAEGDRVYISVQLRAEIRNCRPTKLDRLRVGTQFVDLTDAERAYLASQEALAVHW
jgi:hypothetical protein